MNLGVDETAGAQRQHDPFHRGHDQRLVAFGDGLGREHPDRVARMDPGPLDVFEESRDEHALAIGDGVDVDLDALEVAVDPDGPVGVDDRGRRQLARQVRRRVAEVDGEAADDERRPDDDRVADPLGQGERLLHRVGHPAFRLRDAEPVEQRREPCPLLGLVDGLGGSSRGAGRRPRRAGRPD